jgi:tetratricopeptide (TPR) repeat protein
VNGPLFIVGATFALLGIFLALPGLRAMINPERRQPGRRIKMAHWSAVGGAAIFLTGLMYIIDAQTTVFEQRQMVLLLRMLFMGTALVAGNMYFREYGRVKTIQKEISEAENEQLSQPVSAGRLVNLAGMHRELGQYERARQLLGQALALDPRSPDALYQLGRIHVDAGEDPQAAAVFRRALNAADPADSIRGEIEAALREAEKRLNRA